MYIVAFEGLDKSGKHTQSHLLKTHLESLGYSVQLESFHQYDTPTGQLIRTFLDGEYEADVETISLLIAADKTAQKARYVKMQEEGTCDFLILDRYIGSQVCFMLAQGMDSKYVDMLQRSLLRPDIEFFLDIEVATSMKRKGKYGENDIYERNEALLTAVRSEYEKYFWGKSVILAEDKSIEEVHEELILQFSQHMERLESPDSEFSFSEEEV